MRLLAFRERRANIATRELLLERDPQLLIDRERLNMEKERVIIEKERINIRERESVVANVENARQLARV